MSTAPHTTQLEATIPALGAAVTGDQTLGESPYAGTLSVATFTPEANITGDATNYRTLTIVNKGADGNGTTVMATLALTAGVTPTDFNEHDFTLGVAANLVVAAGDVLAVVETVAASGLANPGGQVRVEISRT